VSSPGKTWRISKIANQARRAIEALDLDTQGKILRELDSLQSSPFSGDIKKIKGKNDIYRVRMGSFRIYFRIVLASREIEILVFDQRGSIKDKTLKRI